MLRVSGTVPHLARWAVGLGLVLLLLYEGAALAVNLVQLDGVGRDAARRTSLLLQSQSSHRGIEDAVRQALSSRPDMQLQAIQVQPSEVTFTITRPAHVLVLDRIQPLRHVVDGTVTRTVRRTT
jgi:hypothetical protein